MCRTALDIRNPAAHPVNGDLEAAVLALVSREAYDAKLTQAKEQVVYLQEKARTHLPIFFMRPGTQVGDSVLLHLFEPRYRILIRRAWEGNRLFVYCASTPRSGIAGVIVAVNSAQFLPDGRANIVGKGVQAITLGETWVEEGTAGLFYTKVDGAGGLEALQDPVPEVAEAEPAAHRRARAASMPARCPGCSCALM